MKNKIFIFTVLAITTITFTMLYAQSKENIKLTELKGKIEKIVFSTDEGDVTFEGDEAKDIQEILENYYSEDYLTLDVKRAGDKDKIIIVKKGNSDSSFNRITASGELIDSLITVDELKGTSKTISIEIENGDKKVTVTEVGEDGEEIKKTYEGDEAEKYIKKLKEDDNISILQIDEIGGEKDKVRVIIEKMIKEKK